MIILDTNVLSELMRAAPNRSVVAWISGQAAASLFTTTITEAEIFHGLFLLPHGRRRLALESAAEAVFREDLAGRVLAFGSDAARAYAHIAAERRRLGRPISQFDAQIAAIARCSGARLATRNIADFEDCRIGLVDPFGPFEPPG